MRGPRKASLFLLDCGKCGFASLHRRMPDKRINAKPYHIKRTTEHEKILGLLITYKQNQFYHLAFDCVAARSRSIKSKPPKTKKLSPRQPHFCPRQKL